MLRLRRPLVSEVVGVADIRLKAQLETVVQTVRTALAKHPRADLRQRLRPHLRIVLRAATVAALGPFAR